MEIVAFLNRKGGVGKSTTCHHIAGALAAAGRTVLLADLDPQASLTRGIFGDAWTDALDRLATVVAAFVPGAPGTERVGRVAPYSARVAVVPGSVGLGPANDHVPADGPPPPDLGGLGPYLRAGGVAEVCLVDCPPNLAGCSWAALAAADGLVVPLVPEDYGAMGLVAVLEFAARVRAEANPGLRTLGLLFNKVERTRLHARYRAAIRAEYGPLVFAAEIGQRVRLAEAVTGRTTIDLYEPRGKAAEEVGHAAGEMMARLSRAGALAGAGAGAGKGVA